MYKVAREVNYIPTMTKPEENAYKLHLRNKKEVGNAIFFSRGQILFLFFKYVTSTYSTDSASENKTDMNSDYSFLTFQIVFIY